MKLTETKIKTLKGGRYSDTGGAPGLILRVSPKHGRRYWIHRLVVHGRLREIGLGGWPELSLDEARARVWANRRARLDGIDPLDVKRRAAGMPTFEALAVRYMEANDKRGKAAKVWLSRLTRYAFPRLGSTPVDRIDGLAVLNVLTPIWTAKPELARKLRQQIRQIMGMALALGHCKTNPAGEGIDGALPRVSKVANHHAALPYSEVAEALDVIDSSDYSLSLKLLMRFQILTATRPSEARKATWGEIDLKAKTWTIPAARMKSSKPHRVPLSDEAMAVLKQARRLGPWGDSNPVFPSKLKPGKPLSDRALLTALETTGLKARTSAHGFRSSFRDWAAENGKDRTTAEAALAHVVGGVEGAYFRSDLFDRRRGLMNEWAAYLSSAQAEKVVNA